MDSAIRKSQMKQVSAVAERLELTTNHYFGQTDPATKNRHNLATAPKLANSGLFFLDCIKCKRSIFADGTGSASGSPCVL
jgi:hypothetical protein